jgi:hypothetical protein
MLVFPRPWPELVQERSERARVTADQVVAEFVQGRGGQVLQTERLINDAKERIARFRKIEETAGGGSSITPSGCLLMAPQSFPP